MALKKNFSVNFNEFSSNSGFVGFDDHVISDEFYIRVLAVNGSKVHVYAVVEFKGTKLFKNKSYDFVPKMDGSNFIKQAYEHLKTLPEFAGTVDC